MMVVLGNRSQRESDEEEDEEVGSGGPTYRGGEGEEENEDSSDDDHDVRRTKELSPLWKYVTRLGGGKGGGTTKFTCPFCNITFTGSYTRVRKHLCGPMPCDEHKPKKSGIRTCTEIEK